MNVRRMLRRNLRYYRNRRLRRRRLRRLLLHESNCRDVVVSFSFLNMIIIVVCVVSSRAELYDDVVDVTSLSALDVVDKTKCLRRLLLFISTT